MHARRKSYATKGVLVEDILDRMKEATGLSTQAELARHLGIRRAAITDAKRRNAIPSEWFLKLSRSHGLNPLWLESGLGPKHIGKGEEVRETPAPYEMEEFAFVPMAKARVSGGGGSLETDDEVESWYAFRNEWLARKGGIREMRLMRVTGDSMDPTLKDEDMVLIDLSQEDVYPGKIYAVRIDQEIVVKRLDKKPGKLVLVSDNRNLYDAYEVPLDGSADVRVLGRVIWVGREII